MATFVCPVLGPVMPDRVEGAPAFPFKGTELVAVGAVSSNSRSDRKHPSCAPVTSCSRPGTP